MNGYLVNKSNPSAVSAAEKLLAQHNGIVVMTRLEIEAIYNGDVTTIKDREDKDMAA